MVGKIVKITDKTHQEEIPESRCGIVLEAAEGYNCFIYNVLFPETGKVLKFHSMFLEEVNEND